MGMYNKEVKVKCLPDIIKVVWVLVAIKDREFQQPPR